MLLLTSLLLSRGILQTEGLGAKMPHSAEEEGWSPWEGHRVGDVPIDADLCTLGWPSSKESLSQRAVRVFMQRPAHRPDPHAPRAFLTVFLTQCHVL